MSDARKEAEEKMAKAIFISADCWLCVFDLISPRQLGLGISMISPRFNFYVDEHFKTRRWALKSMKIKRKKSWNNTKEMEIANSPQWKSLPIPQKPLPKKVAGFRAISIEYIDSNVITFLRQFRTLFASKCPINLAINTTNDRISEFIFRNIWPLLGKNLYGFGLFASLFRRLRKFVPSLFNELPLLRVVKFHGTNFFTEFPCDDSAMASDGQAVAKWLFTPLQNNVPKVFKCYLDTAVAILVSRIEAFKSAFASASSPVNFIVFIWFPSSSSAAVVPFVLTNELTRERLTLKRANNRGRFLLIRCPIARDESKWAKWEKEAIDLQIYDQWNQIDIQVNGDDGIGNGLLDATPGPSDQQNDCPSLRVVFFSFNHFFTEFPADDSAAASDGQVVAKWLFTPLQSNVPKVLKCYLDTDDGEWSSNIAAFKAAFASASSSANFIVVIWFLWSSADSVAPFDLINELTREQLALKRINDSNRFLLIRCPIARDESKWTKWEEEAIG
ncbi:hypothetical protein niasHT_032908 [Heterodera trifolii]|uniref:Uncharacterized protein n=1 Tax=Heterodera trifolii TaxID=157864 RepID=A0ABD2IUA4_9BILA